jgi:hypothetical protein
VAEAWLGLIHPSGGEAYTSAADLDRKLLLPRQQKRLRTSSCQVNGLHSSREPNVDAVELVIPLWCMYACGWVVRAGVWVEDGGTHIKVSW